MGGKVVRLVRGKREAVTFEASDPLRIAELWVEKGAKVLHVVDLDGSFEGRLRHEEVIRKISKLGVELQVGGGIRDFKTAERVLKYADRVILGTLAVEGVEEVRRFAAEYPNAVMIALDSRGGRIAVRGWRELKSLTPKELAQLYADLEVSFLYTNIDVEGLVSGVDRRRLEEIAEIKKPIVAAGGFSSVEDIRLAKRMGFAGVVVGSALYTGKLKFEEALKVEHEEED